MVVVVVVVVGGGGGGGSVRRGRLTFSCCFVGCGGKRGGGRGAGRVGRLVMSRLPSVYVPVVFKLAAVCGGLGVLW